MNGVFEIVTGNGIKEPIYLNRDTYADKAEV